MISDEDSALRCVSKANRCRFTAASRGKQCRIGRATTCVDVIWRGSANRAVDGNSKAWRFYTTLPRYTHAKLDRGSGKSVPWL
jgi:hypothetical protein